MQTFAQIQDQVGVWSRSNFGFQDTPYLEIIEAGGIVAETPRTHEDNPDYCAPVKTGIYVAQLNELAPLLGIAEEVGELMEAMAKEDAASIEDALGDIAIYLCDYCSRANTQFPVRPSLSKAEQLPPPAGVAAAVGRLCRAHLKRHQRIRGFHDIAVYREAEDAALSALVWHLEKLAADLTPGNLLEILNRTWNGIVKKRNWRADADTGGGHTHTPARPATTPNNSGA